MNKLLTLFCMAILLISVNAWSATYYMRADGTAANKGAASGPCGTVGNCMSIATHDGETFSGDDVINICDDGGVYRDQMDIPSSGTSGHPITYQAESGDTPIISGADLIAPGASWSTYTGQANHVYKDDSNLQALWLMEEASGTRYDETANNNDLTDVNTVTRTATHKEGSYAAEFTLAQTEYLSEAEGDVTGFNNVEDFSICFWYWLKSAEATSQTLIGFWDGTNGGFSLTHHANQVIRLVRLGDGANSVSDINGGTGGLTTDTWYHVALTLDGSTGDIELYLDGSDDGGSAGTAVTKMFMDDGVSPLTIGKNSWAGLPYHLDGYIDEMAIFDRVLSPAEVASVEANGIEEVVPANIWQATVNTEPYVVLFDGTLGTKKTAIANLNATNEWFWVGNVLYVYCVNDPDTEYTSPGIEAGKRDTCIHLTSNNQGNYTTFDGLTLEAANYGGNLEGAFYAWTNAVALTDVIIQNCTVRKTALDGIYFCNAHVALRTVNITVQNNTVTQAGGNGIYYSLGVNTSTMSENTVSYTGWSVDADFTSGIRVFGNYVTGDDIVIEKNEIHHAYDVGDYTEGVGIWLDTISGVGTVRYNYVHDNEGHGINIEENSGNVIIYNIVSSNGRDGLLLNGAAAHPANGNLVYNNVFYSNTTAGMTIDGSGSSSIVNTLVKNNISIGNTPELKATDGGENDGTNGSGNVYEYNCFGPESSNFIKWGTGVYKSTYDAWETSYGSGTNSVEANPLFTNAAGGDFTLKPGSPCRHGATHLSGHETKLRPEASWPDNVTTMDDILSIGAYGIYRGSAGM